MRITQTIAPLLPLLRAGGLNARVRGWDRALRSLFPIASQTKEFVTITYRGRPYAAAPSHYVDWQVLTTGSYEPDDLAVIARIMARFEKPVVLDIGTNVGHHAFAFATMGAEVHGFEPNPSLWPIVEAKIAAAELGTLRLHRVGLGEADAQLGFAIPEKSNSGTGQFLPTGMPAEQVLPIRNGDAYLAAAGITRVSFMKMDVQGFEPQALRGLARTLERDRPFVCVEVGDENRAAIPALASLAALLPSGYEFNHVGYDTGLVFRRPRLQPLTAERFPRFEGNVFCAPAERAAWLGDEAAA